MLPTNNMRDARPGTIKICLACSFNYLLGIIWAFGCVHFDFVDCPTMRSHPFDVWGMDRFPAIFRRIGIYLIFEFGCHCQNEAFVAAFCRAATNEMESNLSRLSCAMVIANYCIFISSAVLTNRPTTLQLSMNLFIALERPICLHLDEWILSCW